MDLDHHLLDANVESAAVGCVHTCLSLDCVETYVSHEEWFLKMFSVY